jgi:membrane-associated phospholipid phosphatase
MLSSSWAQARSPWTSQLPQVGLAVLAWAALTGVLIGVGELVVHSTTITSWDRHVTTVVVDHRSPALDTAMKAVTWLGSWVAVVVAAVVLLVLRFAHLLPTLAVLLAVLAWAGEDSGTVLAKHIVDRARPPRSLWLVVAHGASWPSGHVGQAVLVYGTLAAVVGVLSSRKFLRIGAWAVAALTVMAVAFSRVELGVHWTTDVIAGFVFVAAWLLLLAVLFGRRREADGKRS